MDLTQPLAIDLQADNADAIRLILRGDLDLATAPIFAEYLREACEKQPCVLLLDFTDLTFCDSSGIRACVEAAKSCVEAGAQMRIIGARPSIRRVFEVVALDEYFEWLDATA